LSNLEKFIMRREIVNPLLLALGMMFGGGAMSADTTGPGGIYASESADGGVVLSNISSAGSQQTVVAAPDPAAAAAAAEAQKDPREQYRDIMLQGTEGTTAENPAVSRRYKMMDRETYRATVLGVTPQASPTPAKSQ
jgi:hypothetical protein